jgi:cell division protein FtsQ
MNSTSLPVEIRQRRLALKRQRQVRIAQSLWRLFLISSLAGGLIWASLLPKWGIRQPQQVKIQGNQYLSTEALRQILTPTQSDSIITLSPQQIKNRLQSQAPIQQATVARDLYPPQLTIAIDERKPVAMTVPNPNTVNPLGKGYLDATGVWMPKESYRSSDRLTPSLKVIGYRPQYRFQWAKIYPQLQASPVEIQAVNWQNPANLILETELGQVYLGGNTDILSQQLQLLAKLKNLPEKVPPKEIRYINLKNPDFILIELNDQSKRIDHE